MRLAVFYCNENNIRLLSNVCGIDMIYIIEENPYKWLLNGKKIGVANISLNSAVKFYMEKKIDKFLFLPILKRNLWNFYESIIDMGIDEKDILYAPILKVKIGLSDVNDFVIFRERKELDFLGIQISQHCNLRCAHCSALTGLVTSSEDGISFEATKDSIVCLSRRFDSINYIQILGGEPLLCCNIIQYCAVIREYFPFSYIEIVTNGTLLKSQKDEFFDTIRELNIALSVSYYPILGKDVDEINLILKQKGISYVISDRIDYFEKYYDLAGNADSSKTFYNCQSAQYCKNGLTLKENRLYPCVAPVALKRAGISDVEQYGIDLKESFENDDIYHMMGTSMELCRYCHMDMQEKWRQLEKDELYIAENWSI